MKSLEIVLSFLFFLYKLAYGRESPVLLVANTGPAVLGANVTFSASLLNYRPRHPLTFEFRDVLGVRREIGVGEEPNVNASFPYPSSSFEEGAYNMRVTVYSDNFFYRETVVFNESRFELKRELLGKLSVYNLDSINVDEVAVGENVSFSLDLYDPTHFLDKADIEFSWSVDFERQRTENGTLVYKFDDPGPKDIKVAVTALFPNNDFKYGLFEKTITAKIPVNSVNVTGNPFLYHGDTLNLNVTCNGTPPFVYCYEVLRGNVSAANFTCSHVTTFTTCRMEIVKYIQVDGTYQVAIFLSNNVRQVKRVIEVVVYSVTVHPTLSIVIIPVVCALLTLIIVVLGVSRFLQQRRQMAVEVASFDFQDESDVQERTFFEGLFGSLSCTPRSRSDIKHLVDSD